MSVVSRMKTLRAASAVALFVLAAGCGGGGGPADPTPPQPDQTRPARVLDLAQHAATATSVTVSWSLAGDDSLSGRAASYDVRYAEAPLTEETWAAATPVATTPQPHPNPAKRLVTITGLPAATTFHVGLKATDDAGNVSALSNVIAVQVGTMRTFYVRLDGTGDFPTLNQAIAAAQPGDVVLVAAGRYTWTNQGDGDATQGLFVVHRDQTDFTIRGESGAAATILDAQQHSRVLYVEGGTFGEGEARTWAGVTIEGFTFTNGRALGTPGELGSPWAGAGIALHLTDTLVRDCIFRGNEAREGGAVWMGGQGGSRLEDCLLEDNVAETGGGAFLVNSEPVMSVSGCTIRNNIASLAGGGLYANNVGLELDTTLLAGNTAADRGGGMYLAALHAGSWLETCSVLDNASPVGSGIRLAYPMTVSLRSSLVAFNNGGAGLESVASGTGSGAVVEAACVLRHGNAGGDALPFGAVDLGGNLVTDPLLCPDGRQPSPASPCLPGNRAGGDDCGLIGALGAGCGG